VRMINLDFLLVIATLVCAYISVVLAVKEAKPRPTQNRILNKLQITEFTRLTKWGYVFLVTIIASLILSGLKSCQDTRSKAATAEKELASAQKNDSLRRTVQVMANDIQALVRLNTEYYVTAHRVDKPFVRKAEPPVSKTVSVDNRPLQASGLYAEIVGQKDVEFDPMNSFNFPTSKRIVYSLNDSTLYPAVFFMSLSSTNRFWIYHYDSNNGRISDMELKLEKHKGATQNGDAYISTDGKVVLIQPSKSVTILEKDRRTVFTK
jgi:hypothetical protein